MSAHCVISKPLQLTYFGVEYPYLELSEKQEKGKGKACMKNESSCKTEYFLRDGKFTRRTFVKGAGLITVASAFGFSVLNKSTLASGETAEDEITDVHAVCTVNCTSRCHVQGQVKGGKLIGAVPGDMPGRPDYANTCLRAMAYTQHVQNEEARVMFPMKRTGERGSGQFERITWDEAASIITEKLKAVVDKDPSAASFYSFTGNLGKLSWEASTRFAACLGATTWEIEGIMGDHGASMGMQLVFGQQRGGHDTRDYQNSKMLVLWGRNIADTHTCEMRYVIDAKEAGAKIIVVDPRQCSSAAVADQWIALNPQTDPALALGMMKVIIDNDLYDKAWLLNFSCAPYLVRDDDAQYLRDAAGSCLVWDTATEQSYSVGGSSVEDSSVGAKPWESLGTADSKTEGAEETESALALSGSFIVGGVKCHTAFDSLKEEVAKYTLEYASEITGVAPDIIETFALEYARAKPAGIRMGQGMQRVYHSYAPFRTVATLAALTGNVGKSGGGASHMGGTSSAKPIAGYSGPVFNFANWADTGGKKDVNLKSSKIYDAAITKDPVAIDFLWIANSNFINMSPDVNHLINNVLPNIDFIVTVDPWWTWTAKYSDIVLPGTSYWEKWDMVDRSPWVMLNQPSIAPMGESKSDVEIMSLIAKQIGLEQHWNKTDEEWLRDFLTSDHPGVKNLDFEELKRTGIYVREDALLEPLFSFADKKFKTKTGKFEFYTEELAPFNEQVPTWKPPAEDPRGELGKKYPLVFIQYHDRLNVHTQHILIEPLKIVEAEPLLHINPVDASVRNVAHNDVLRVFNDRGECKVKAFVNEGIIPGTVAMPSGWTPDYFIEGNHQELTHYIKNDTEEFLSQTSTAFYDVLVQVEKA
jgi:anaerobic selenocysteine-containing dehydrogenase